LLIGAKWYFNYKKIKNIFDASIARVSKWVALLFSGKHVWLTLVIETIVLSWHSIPFDVFFVFRRHIWSTRSLIRCWQPYPFFPLLFLLLLEIHASTFQAFSLWIGSSIFLFLFALFSLISKIEFFLILSSFNFLVCHIWDSFLFWFFSSI